MDGMTHVCYKIKISRVFSYFLVTALFKKKAERAVKIISKQFITRINEL